VAVLGLTALVLLLGGVEKAQAGYTGLTSRAALGANDFEDWGTLGPSFSTPSNPFAATSNGGLGLSVSQQQPGSFQRLDQNNGWGGNFAPGDALLYTAVETLGSAGGPIIISFSHPVVGAGAQIQEDLFGTFTAEILALDGSGNVLGSFSEDGISNGNGDNSAIFIGIKDSSNAASISKIEFALTAAQNGPTTAFAINEFSIDSAAVAAVPAPPSVIPLAIGALGLLGYGWRKRKQAA
jgi:hypothetical protein